MVNELVATRLQDLMKLATVVLCSVQHGRSHITEFHSLPWVNVTNKPGFFQLRAGTIAFMESVFGRTSSLYEQAAAIEDKDYESNCHRLAGILAAAKDQIDGGFLKSINTTVAAEVFQDFIEQALHLVEQGYKIPAASLAGAVLEDGMRTIATNKSLTFKNRAGLNDLNTLLTGANVYNRIEFGRVDSWRLLRNAADHGNFGDFDEAQARNMVEGIRDFLAKYL